MYYELYSYSDLEHVQTLYVVDDGWNDLYGRRAVPDDGNPLVLVVEAVVPPGGVERLPIKLLGTGDLGHTWLS